MKSLRVQVERVVRPIRAGARRKDRMREELLTHLTRIYEEELSRSGDVEQATAQAIRRFGDPGALTSELQASVSRIERWGAIPLVSARARRRPEETPMQYLLRAILRGFAWISVAVVAFGILLAFVANLRPPRADQPSFGQLAGFLAGFLVIQFGGVLLTGLISEGIRQALERRAAADTNVERRRAVWQIAAYTLGSCLVVYAGSFAAGMLLLRFTVAPWIPLDALRYVVLTAVALGVPLTLMQARDWTIATRRFENWESLRLDESL